MNLLAEASSKGKRELKQYRTANGIETPIADPPPTRENKTGLKEGALEHHKKNQEIREAKANLKQQVNAFTEFVLTDPEKAMETLSQLAVKVPMSVPTDPDEFKALCAEISESIYKAIADKVKF